MDEAAGSIPVTSTNSPIPPSSQKNGGRVRSSRIACRGSLHVNNLFQNFGAKSGESIAFYGVTDLNGVATNLTILDVGLAAD
jgi:hypothetical protein